MPRYTHDQLREIFSTSSNFNELSEALEDALAQRLRDTELYRALLTNRSLSIEEMAFFCEKVAQEFPDDALELYLWMAKVFELTKYGRDNYEMAMTYYKKAAALAPDDSRPYLMAAQSYNTNIKLPPLDSLITFLKEGVKHVAAKDEVYTELSRLHELAGNIAMSLLYKDLAAQHRLLNN